MRPERWGRGRRAAESPGQVHFPSWPGDCHAASPSGYAACAAKTESPGHRVPASRAAPLARTDAAALLCLPRPLPESAHRPHSSVVPKKSKTWGHAAGRLGDDLLDNGMGLAREWVRFEGAESTPLPVREASGNDSPGPPPC